MIFLPEQKEIVRYVIDMRRMLENSYCLEVANIYVRFCNGELNYIVELEKESRHLPVLKDVTFTVENT